MRRHFSPCYQDEAHAIPGGAHANLPAAAHDVSFSPVRSSPAAGPPSEPFSRSVRNLKATVFLAASSTPKSPSFDPRPASASRSISTGLRRRMSPSKPAISAGPSLSGHRQDHVTSRRGRHLSRRPLLCRGGVANPLRPPSTSTASWAGHGVKRDCKFARVQIPDPAGNLSRVDNAEDVVFVYEASAVADGRSLFSSDRLGRRSTSLDRILPSRAFRIRALVGFLTGKIASDV
jgi:hypothetical protein